MRLMEIRKYCFVLLFGLLAGGAGHAHDFSGFDYNEFQQEEVGADSQRVPLHYERINLLSMQQAFQESPSHFPFVLFSESTSAVWMSRWEDSAFSFLQDIRFLLEIQLFPFHSFW